MKKDTAHFDILVIEDNPGDFLLVNEYLYEFIYHPNISQAKNYSEAKSLIESKHSSIDLVLLDLTLPDKQGVDLVQEVMKIAHQIPVIILTGFSDLSFAVQTLSLGIADYLLKDDLNSILLYKSIKYNIERNKNMKSIKDSEEKYSDLFHLSPQPMWMCDLENLQIIEVNKAAIEHYQYTEDEFLTMTMKQIVFNEDFEEVDEEVNAIKIQNLNFSQKVYRHLKKNGTIIFVDVRFNIVKLKNKKSLIVLANDITERIHYVEAIEAQNEKLRSIAWTQSHVVRAPLARIMGLVNLIEDDEITSVDEKKELLKHVIDSVHELDYIVKDIIDKSQNIIPPSAS